MNDKGFTAVIFDLDGTLIEIDDIRKHADDVLKRTLSRFGVRKTAFRDRYRFFFCGIGFLDMLEKWGIKNEDQKRTFIKTLSEEECDEKRRLTEQGSMRPYKDASILDALHGRVKLGLVTNSSSKAASLELHHFRMDGYFASVVTLGDFDNNLAPKPDPDGILQCLREIREPPSKTIVVGDNLTDAIAGVRSGTHTAIVHRGRRISLQKEGTSLPRIDYRLGTLQELYAIVV